MRAHVPSNIIDNTYEEFPRGFYSGAIASAAIRDPNNDGSWLTLKIGVDSITPKDGTADPGRASFAAELTTLTDGVDLFEVEDFSNGKLPYPVVLSAGLLTRMAEALGVVTRGPNGSDLDLREFAGKLIDGKFVSERIGFQVTHYTTKGDNPKTYDQYGAFGSAE